MLLSLHLTQNYVINGREKTMRLIDVDELKKRATKVMFRDAPECGEFDAVAVDDIDCMPTIDPETLRPTGRWELHGNDDDTESSYWCSNCNAYYAEDMFYPDGYVNGHWEEKTFSYCPNCGARMVNADD